jgi:hypothetical protein
LALVSASILPVTTLRRRSVASLTGELSTFQAAPRMDVTRAAPNEAPATREPVATGRAVPVALAAAFATGRVSGRSGLAASIAGVNPANANATAAAGRECHRLLVIFMG